MEKMKKKKKNQSKKPSAFSSNGKGIYLILLSFSGEQYP